MICIHDSSCMDFSGNGLGTLSPTSCSVTETLNGEYEVTLVHPLDEGGKWARIALERIIRVPVPSSLTPRFNLVTQSSYNVYKTNGSNRPLRATADGNGKVLAKYAKDKKVVLVNQTSATWWEVTGADGKRGFMQAAHLTFVETKYNAAEAKKVIESKQLRDRPFRVYKIVPELNQITVYARHVFYDLLDNMIRSYAPGAAATGAAVLQGISAA